MPTSHNIRLSAHFQVMTLRVRCIEKCELLCFHTTKSLGTAASTSFLSSLVPLLDLLWIPPSLLIKGPWELSLACPLKSIQAWFITSHIKKEFWSFPFKLLSTCLLPVIQFFEIKSKSADWTFSPPVYCSAHCKQTSTHITPLELLWP